jgi:hypothetical protein
MCCRQWSQERSWKRWVITVGVPIGSVDSHSSVHRERRSALDAKSTGRRDLMQLMQEQANRQGISDRRQTRDSTPTSTDRLR